MSAYDRGLPWKRVSAGVLFFDARGSVLLVDPVLYHPDDTPPGWPALGGSLTRAIKWDLIEQQYDQMVKYATALRPGTAEAEQVLWRFT